MSKKYHLHCVLLVTRGEIIEGSQELEKLGYEVESYPTTQDISCLQDSVDNELAPIFPWKHDLDTPYARSLRSSFVRMILDPRFSDDDLIIFGESDAAPVTAAKELRASLEQHMSQFPETELFRLFLHKQTTCPSESIPSESFGFIPLPSGTRSKLNTSVWGTHALVIPSASRRKLADIFSHYRLPTDNALEAASYRKELNMRIATHNHFYQKPRTRMYDKSVSYACRQRRIALCLAISSMDQIDDMLRQIECLMQQPYQAFHLFVSVNGVTNRQFREEVLPRLTTWQGNSQLTVRHFQEAPPAMALANTVRDLDISAYDLFVRMEPAITCKTGILTAINDFHTGIPQFYSGFLKESDTFQAPFYSLQPRAMGAFMDFTRNPEAIPGLIPAIPSERQYQYLHDVPVLLDAIIAHLGKKAIPPSLGKLLIDKPKVM